MYPAWRQAIWPDEGEFVAHVHWREVLDMIGQSFAPPSPPDAGETSAAGLTARPERTGPSVT